MHAGSLDSVGVTVPGPTPALPVLDMAPYAADPGRPTGLVELHPIKPEMGGEKTFEKVLPTPVDKPVFGASLSVVGAGIGA